MIEAKKRKINKTKKKYHQQKWINKTKKITDQKQMKWRQQNNTSSMTSKIEKQEKKKRNIHKQYK